MEKILVVEDSDFDFELIRHSIGSEFQIERASNISEVQNKATTSNYQIFIVDLVLQQGSGYEVCSFLRSLNQYETTPIIILSSKSDTENKVAGLRLGADDYLVKPIDASELRARVERKILAQRNSSNQSPIKKIGALTINIESGNLSFDTPQGLEHVELTPTEFRLFLALTKKPGDIFNRKQLAEASFGENYNISLRTIDVHIGYLRKKLGAHAECLETIYGMGYRFSEGKLKKAA